MVTVIVFSIMSLISILLFLPFLAINPFTFLIAYQLSFLPSSSFSSLILLTDHD